jgi:hypothetical protein
MLDQHPLFYPFLVLFFFKRDRRVYISVATLLFRLSFEGDSAEIFSASGVHFVEFMNTIDNFENQ